MYGDMKNLRCSQCYDNLHHSRDGLNQSKQNRQENSYNNHPEPPPLGHIATIVPELEECGRGFAVIGLLYCRQSQSPLREVVRTSLQPFPDANPWIDMFVRPQGPAGPLIALRSGNGQNEFDSIKVFFDDVVGKQGTM